MVYLTPNMTNISDILLLSRMISDLKHPLISVTELERGNLLGKLDNCTLYASDKVLSKG